MDFIYQARIAGIQVGRLEKGDITLDFLFANPPNIAINVQGTFFHYEQGVDQKSQDQLARAQAAGLGIELIFIDDNQVHEDVEFYVREALRGNDHSFFARGIF